MHVKVSFSICLQGTIDKNMVKLMDFFYYFPSSQIIINTSRSLSLWCFHTPTQANTHATVNNASEDDRASTESSISQDKTRTKAH